MILLQENGRVIDSEESVSLTATCVTDGACVSGEYTYKLLESPSTCDMKEVRTIAMTRVVLPHGTNREEQYWVSQEHKIVLRRAGELQVAGCSRLSTSLR